MIIVYEKEANYNIIDEIINEISKYKLTSNANIEYIYLNKGEMNRLYSYCKNLWETHNETPYKNTYIPDTNNVFDFKYQNFNEFLEMFSSRHIDTNFNVNGYKIYYYKD